MDIQEKKIMVIIMAVTDIKKTIDIIIRITILIREIIYKKREEEIMEMNIQVKIMIIMIEIVEIIKVGIIIVQEEKVKIEIIIMSILLDHQMHGGLVKENGIEIKEELKITILIAIIVIKTVIIMIGKEIEIEIEIETETEIETVIEVKETTIQYHLQEINQKNYNLLYQLQ